MSAINISSVGRGLCLVIGLLLVLSLLLGSCNVAASAFCGQSKGRRLTNPILTLHRHSKQQTCSEYNRHNQMNVQMSTESQAGRQYRHEQGRTSPHFPTPLSDAAATNCVPFAPSNTFHLYQTSSCGYLTLRHQQRASFLSFCSDSDGPSSQEWVWRSTVVSRPAAIPQATIFIPAFPYGRTYLPVPDTPLKHP